MKICVVLLVACIACSPVLGTYRSTRTEELSDWENVETNEELLAVNKRDVSSESTTEEPASTEPTGITESDVSTTTVKETTTTASSTTTPNSDTDKSVTSSTSSKTPELGSRSDVDPSTTTTPTPVPGPALSPPLLYNPNSGHGYLSPFGGNPYQNPFAYNNPNIGAAYSPFGPSAVGNPAYNPYGPSSVPAYGNPNLNIIPGSNPYYGGWTSSNIGPSSVSVSASGYANTDGSGPINNPGQPNKPTKGTPDLDTRSGFGDDSKTGPGANSLNSEETNKQPAARPNNAYPGYPLPAYGPSVVSPGVFSGFYPGSNPYTYSGYNPVGQPGYFNPYGNYDPYNPLRDVVYSTGPQLIPGVNGNFGGSAPGTTVGHTSISTGNGFASASASSSSSSSGPGVPTIGTRGQFSDDDSDPSGNASSEPGGYSSSSNYNNGFASAGTGSGAFAGTGYGSPFGSSFGFGGMHNDAFSAARAHHEAIRARIDAQRRQASAYGNSWASAGASLTDPTGQINSNVHTYTYNQPSFGLVMPSVDNNGIQIDSRLNGIEEQNRRAFASGNGHSATSSIAVGPNGGHRSGSINPAAPGIESRFSDDLPAPTGNNVAVFSGSSVTSFTDENGNQVSKKKSTTAFNDNGRVYVRTLED